RGKRKLGQAWPAGADGHHQRHGLRAARRPEPHRWRKPGNARRRDRAFSQVRGGGSELADSLGDRESGPMSDLFNSVRADLLDRRMRPFLALAVVAVVAAFAYALLGGGGGSPAPSPETSPLGAGSAPGGMSVSASATNANGAVARVS